MIPATSIMSDLNQMSTRKWLFKSHFCIKVQVAQKHFSFFYYQEGDRTQGSRNVEALLLQHCPLNKSPQGLFLFTLQS